MKLRRAFKIAAVVIAVPVLLLLLLLLYLNFADLSGWKDTVAGLLTETLGRKVEIHGAFETDIGFSTTLTAGGISLANAEWASETTMASIDHLEFEVRLLSLLSGPIDLQRLEVDGVRLLLEADGQGRGNWEFGTEDQDLGDTAPFELALGQIHLKDVEVVYRDPSLDQPIAVGAEEVAIRGEDADMLDVQLAGHFNHNELGVKGRLGPLAGLLQSRNVEHDLSGHLGGIDFSSRGRIAELTTLGGAAFEINIHGTELTAVGEFFDLAGLEPIPFQVDLAVTPAAAGSALTLGASAGAMTAAMTGTVDSLIKPGVLDVSVEASGPDVAVIGALGGVEGLPSEPFDVSGRVRWEGFPVTCERVEVTVGGNSLAADGVVGEPPLMLGTDFNFEGGGPDIASIAALAGVKLPSDNFSVAGRLVRLEEGIAVEGVDVRVGRSTLAVDGTVGDPPEYAGTALTIQGVGPNLAHFQDLAGIALPAEPFEISGKLVQGQAAIGLEGVRARLGSNVLQVSGQLTTESNLAGTDLRLKARGPNAAQVAAIADADNVPAEPFSVEGRVRVTPQGYRVNDLVASLGSLSIAANGFIAQPPTLIGSDLQIHVEDPDLSHPAAIAGITGLPHDAFSVDTRLRVEDAGYRLDGFESKVADMSLAADGLIGTPPNLEGTDLQITAHGPRVGDLGHYLKQPNLPAVPFSVAGGLRIEDAAFLLDTVVAKVGGNRTEISGTVMPGEGLAGTDLSFDSRGSDLGEIESLAAGFIELAELPRNAYSLTGGVSIDGTGFDLRKIELKVGSSIARATGRLGTPPELLGSDLTVDIDEPDAELFAALTGVTVPIAPLEIAGRVERDDAGFRFYGVTARLGDYRAEVDGTLGELPKLIGTDLEIHASGPDTNLYEALAGLPDLPDKPFTLDGRFSGTPERFASRDFRLTFGGSDLQGVFRIDITGKPAVEARLTSQILDFSRFRERLEDAEDATPGTTKASKKTEARGPLLIPDEPVALAWLQAVDADVAIRVEQLHLRANSFRDLTVDVHLEDGRLEIDRATAAGRGEGRLTGSLLLEPHHETYRLETDISLWQVRLDPPDAVTELLERPPIDIDFDLEAVGATPHELATSTNGAVRLVIGKGIFDSSLLDLVTADILLTLLKAFNPFAKEDPTTELQCGVALLSFDDGVAKLEPMAFQSDKMTLLGDGRIDFHTEKLKLEWIAKPRKGIGISASMLTNPYIKLGGTLAEPSLELKPLEAVTSTGVAVATLGISLVAKGMFDRITAEKKVCKKALEEIESHTAGSSR